MEVLTAPCSGDSLPVVVKMQIAPKAHSFDYLVSAWWDCVGRIRRDDLIGDGTFWEPTLKFQNMCTIPRVLALCFFLVIARCELSAASSVPWLLAYCDALYCDGHGL